MKNSINHNLQTCIQCVLSNFDDSYISFNDEGLCSYCQEENNRFKNSSKNIKGKLEVIIDEIKSTSQNGSYDCLIGVSGGVDSSYLAYQAVKLGLRPLILHYDNGWNSEMAVMNIENIVKTMDLDLYTHVNNWEEFKDIQRSFFKAHVVDIELITDQAIVAIQYQVAAKFNIKYILTGSNNATESILPKSWYHWKSDVLNIKSIHKKFGAITMKTYPTMGYFKRIYFLKIKKIKAVSLLDLMEYNKDKAKNTIIQEMGWRDYGGKHFESIFTRFYQAYILPKKFNIDKRKAHLSALICSGQMTKQEALEELKKPIYDSERLLDDKEYVIKKLGFTEEEFDEYIQAPPISHLMYPSYLTRHYKIEGFFYWLVRPITRTIKKIKNR